MFQAAFCTKFTSNTLQDFPNSLTPSLRSSAERQFYYKDGKTMKKEELAKKVIQMWIDKGYIILSSSPERVEQSQQPDLSKEKQDR